MPRARGTTCPDDSTPLSLEAFAAQTPKRFGPKCWVCEQSQRAEIDKALNGKIRPAVIVKWLQEVQGSPEATLHKIKGHYYGGHHQRKG